MSKPLERFERRKKPHGNVEELKRRFPRREALTFTWGREIPYPELPLSEIRLIQGFEVWLDSGLTRVAIDGVIYQIVNDYE